MPILNLKRLLSVALTLAAASLPVWAQGSREGELFPERVGDFVARRAAAPSAPTPSPFEKEDYEVTGYASSNYVGPGGEKFRVGAFETTSPAAAYSLLRFFHRSPKSLHSVAAGGSPRAVTVEGVGAQGIALPGRLLFVKGSVLVDVETLGGPANGDESLRAFAKLFADTLAGDAGDVPVLVLHLPDWEKKAAEDLGFAVTRPALQQAAGDRPVLDVIDFEGGAEAATATYGGARLVVVEFTTPQHAFDADAAVNQRLAELRADGRPAPALYRREGNYAVFVFDAPDAAAAEQLAAGVKYEKDVRWLGRNPHEHELATREYTAVMGGTILSVIITTGLAIVGCLAVGAAVGGFIFLRRRARLTEQEVYTDAGGMLRLNLEDLNTPPTAKLLRHGKE